MYRAIRNIKIGGKLTAGFGLVLAIMVFLAVFAIGNMRSIDNSMDLFQNYPIIRYNNLNDVRGGITELRRQASAMSFRLGYADYLVPMRNDAQAEYRRIQGLLDENLHSLRTDPAILEDRRDDLMAQTTAFKTLVTQYYNEVLLDMFNVAMGGIVGDAESRERAEEAFARGIIITDDMLNAMTALLDGTRTTIENRRIDMNNTTDTTITTLLILTVAATVLGVGLAFLITRMVTKPINAISRLVETVSTGNLNINFQADVAKDETGIMTANVYALVTVIRNMVDDLLSLERNYNVEGDIEYRIDINKYDNSFKEVVSTSNRLIDNVASDINGFFNQLAEVNDGDFNVKPHELPGKKVMFKNSLLSTMANMAAVNTEIKAMIDAVAFKGDLKFRVDTAKYKGEWQDIMTGLNEIAKAVDKPFTVIEANMEEMKAGNFDIADISAKMTAKGLDANTNNYSGVFRHLLASFDETLREIASYINEISDTLQAIAAGDLTTAIRRPYVGSFSVIKESLNNISSSLSKTMSEISVASAQVLSGAKQIAGSAQDLANGAQEQASSVEELNASIDVISQQTQQNATSAATASELSHKSTQNANAGAQTMTQMLEAMEQIKESSNEISKIIKSIEDITFQTNLLSLNASVEAARAGEHGRGFAVVADEVRNLATKSQQSTVETTSLISDSISRVEAGASIAQATSESLGVIVKSANEILEIIDAISVSSRDQAESIHQISQGLTQISTVVQANSAVSEEAAAASQELNSQAEVLQQLVAFFKI